MEFNDSVFVGVPAEIVVGKPYNVKFVLDTGSLTDDLDVKYRYVAFDSGKEFKYNSYGIDNGSDVVSWVMKVFEEEDDITVVINGDIVVRKGVGDGW